MTWWEFEIIYSLGKTQKAADANFRCKPIHTMYIQVHEEEEENSNDMRDILGVTLGTFHIAIKTV